MIKAARISIPRASLRLLTPRNLVIGSQNEAKRGSGTPIRSRLMPLDFLRIFSTLNPRQSPRFGGSLINALLRRTGQGSVPSPALDPALESPPRENFISHPPPR